MKLLEDEVSKQRDAIAARNGTIRQLEKRNADLEMEIADLTDKTVMVGTASQISLPLVRSACEHQAVFMRTLGKLFSSYQASLQLRAGQHS